MEKNPVFRKLEAVTSWAIAGTIAAFTVPVAVYLLDVYRKRVRYRIGRVTDKITWLAGFGLSIKVAVEIQKIGETDLYLEDAKFQIPKKQYNDLKDIYPEAKKEIEAQIIEEKDGSSVYVNIPGTGYKLETNKRYKLIVEEVWEINQTKLDGEPSRAMSKLKVGEKFAGRGKKKCKMMLLLSNSDKYASHQLRHLKVISKDRVQHFLDKLINQDE